MPGHKTLCLILTCGFQTCLLLLAGLTARAEATSESDEQANVAITNKPSFTASVRETSGQGYITTRAVQFSIGSKRAAFVVPDDFRASTSAPDKVTVYSDDYLSIITFQMADIKGRSMDADSLRLWILERYPGAEIQDELTLSAGNYSGPACDLVHVVDGVKRKTRIGIIPTENGILEFSLTSSPEQFPKGELAFRSVLGSFRTGESEVTVRIVRMYGPS